MHTFVFGPRPDAFLVYVCVSVFLASSLASCFFFFLPLLATCLPRPASVGAPVDATPLCASTSCPSCPSSPRGAARTGCPGGTTEGPAGGERQRGGVCLGEEDSETPRAMRRRRWGRNAHPRPAGGDGGDRLRGEVSRLGGRQRQRQEGKEKRGTRTEGWSRQQSGRRRQWQWQWQWQVDVLFVVPRVGGRVSACGTPPRERIKGQQRRQPAEVVTEKDKR